MYLISSERGMDIISQNKEGVYSIFGELRIRFMFHLPFSFFLFFFPYTMDILTMASLLALFFFFFLVPSIGIISVEFD